MLSILEWRAGNWDNGRAARGGSLALREQFGLGGHAARHGDACCDDRRAPEVASRTLVHRLGAGARRARRRTGFASRNRATGGCSASSSSRWAIRPQRSATSSARGRSATTVQLREPGHAPGAREHLEALIAVGRLDDAERKLIRRGRSVRGRSTATGRWRSRRATAASCSPRVATSRARSRASSSRSPSTPAAPTRSSTRGRCSRSGGRSGGRSGAATRGGRSRTHWRGSRALGAPLWADQTRAELARIGGRAPSNGELTEGERRVAALVAEGRTNREVAAALFLGERTVETHLTHVYRKLGIRSRAELAHLLAAKPEAG